MGFEIVFVMNRVISIVSGYSGLENMHDMMDM